MRQWTAGHLNKEPFFFFSSADLLVLEIIDVG